MVFDPYHQLEETRTPEVIAWFEAQNNHTHRVLDALPNRGALVTRLAELSSKDVHVKGCSRPATSFSTCGTPRRRRYKLYVQPRTGGDGELLVDPDRYRSGTEAATIDCFGRRPAAVASRSASAERQRSRDAARHRRSLARSDCAPIPRARGVARVALQQWNLFTRSRVKTLQEQAIRARTNARGCEPMAPTAPPPTRCFSARASTRRSTSPPTPRRSMFRRARHSRSESSAKVSRASYRSTSRR